MEVLDQENKEIHGHLFDWIEKKDYLSDSSDSDFIKSFLSISVFIVDEQILKNCYELANLFNIKVTSQIVLLSRDRNFKLADFKALKFDFIVAANNSDQKQKLLHYLQNTERDSILLSTSKLSIDQKRSELENYNQKLTSESNKKLSLISGFIGEEEKKTKLERNFLYVLDFISVEILASDFVFKLINFFLKDLGFKEFTGFFAIQLKSSSQHFLISIDNNTELIFSQLIELNDTKDSDGVAEQFANLLKRPVALASHYFTQSQDVRVDFFLEKKIAHKGPHWSEVFFTELKDVVAFSIINWFFEQNKRKTLQLWNLAFSSSKDPIHVIDEDFNLLKSNYDERVKFTDLSSPSHLKCYQVLAKQDFACSECPAKNSLSHSIVNLKGARFQSAASKIEIGNKKYFLIFYKDLSAQDQLRSKLIQTEKLKLLGQLSNHLSHELNNPLTGLKLQTEQLIGIYQNSDPTLIQDLNQIHLGLERCTEIIVDLKSFTQPGDSLSQIIDLKKTVDAVIRLLKSALKNTRLFIDIKNVLVKAHSGYLQQVIFNLVKNAIEALRENGTIKIFTIVENDKIVLIIEDNGIGIPPEMIQNLYQPFQTSKPSIGGSGLGLYISQELCRKMNIELQNDPSFKNGTCFRLKIGVS